MNCWGMNTIHLTEQPARQPRVRHELYLSRKSTVLGTAEASRPVDRLNRRGYPGRAIRDTFLGTLKVSQNPWGETLRTESVRFGPKCSISSTPFETPQSESVRMVTREISIRRSRGAGNWESFDGLPPMA